MLAKYTAFRLNLTAEDFSIEVRLMCVCESRIESARETKSQRQRGNLLWRKNIWNLTGIMSRLTQNYFPCIPVFLFHTHSHTHRDRDAFKSLSSVKPTLCTSITLTHITHMYCVNVLFLHARLFSSVWQTGL